MTTALLDIETATRRLLASVQAIDEEETVGLAEARGRITSRAVMAPRAVPPFVASAMDGYAVCSADPCFAKAPPYRLPVRGRSAAGAPFQQPLAADSAVRILTGAALPERADAIVLQEHATVSNGHIVFTQRPREGAWVRPVGHDVPVGATVFSAGTRLGPFEIGGLAACGIVEVPVTRRVRVVLFSTGDELREPGTVLGPGQIHESNRRVLRELLRDLPVVIEDRGILPDDEATIGATLAQAASDADVVLTSGGVSVGDTDHVRAALEQVGQLEFWRLALKPGKPLAYGRIGCAGFFGLPGNPVSTIVTFLLVVKPVIGRLSGAHDSTVPVWHAVLTERIGHEPGRAEYQRGTYRREDDVITVTPTGDQSSNRLASFTGANCFIHVPRETQDLEPGQRVEVLPFHGIL